jgi:NAD(P)H-nitrite reductase large subunit
MFCTVVEQDFDSEFLTQIDQVDELISSTDKLDDETLICECFCVNVADIRQLCDEHKELDLEKVQSEFNLGQGCQGCLKRIDSWVNKIF